MKKTIILAALVGFSAAVSASAADGKALWTQEHCAMCHGADGKGQTVIGKRFGVKDFTDPKVQAALKDDAAADAMKNGVKGPDGRPLMKPYSNLSESDIKALVQYVRSFKK